MIGYVLSNDKFEQKFVVLKGMLKSPRLKDHTLIIGIDQSLSNNYLYEQKILPNIKNVYKHAGKCDEQQQFIYIIEAAMVSTPEVFTDYIPRSPMTSTPVKTPSSRKPLCLFTNILDAKNKTATCRVVAAKSKRKAIE